MNSSHNSNKSAFGISLFLSMIVSISIFIPIEIYFGSVFLRPILLATLVSWILLIFLSNFSKIDVPFYLINRNYLFYLCLLGIFFLVQTFFQNRLFVGIKELIELSGSIALMILLLKSSKELGLFRFLVILKNISLVGALIWVSFRFLEGNFFTFKDPYWILLIATLLSLIFVKIRGNRFDYFAIYLLSVIDILSASRTLWMTVFVFILVTFGASRIIFASAFFLLFFYFVSSYDAQYNYYLETIYYLLSNYQQVLSNFGSISSADLSNVSDVSRITESYRSILVFLENPYFGVGIDNYQNYINSSINFSETTHLTAHNEFLRILAEGGLALFAIYFFLYRSIWKDISKIPDNRWQRIGRGLVAASLTLAFFTATNFTIHLLLQIALIFLVPFLLNSAKKMSPKR